VGRLRREDLVAFFSKCYVASNLTLVVVGDFDADSARQKIAKAFASLSEESRPRPGPSRPSNPSCAWSRPPVT